MKMNRLYPAIRRRLARSQPISHRSGGRFAAPAFGQASPLTREETRQAVIEVLG